MKRILQVILALAVFSGGAFAQTPTATAAASINQRGLGTRISPSTRAGRAKIVMGSQSYTYSVPLFSLSGRHGLNVNLTLFYNNLIWSNPLPTGGVIFNFDGQNEMSYGFRLDFGALMWDDDTGVLIDSNGAKHALVDTSGGANQTFASLDSTYITVQHHASTGSNDPTSDIVTYKNGTQVQYQAPFSNALGKHNRDASGEDRG
jgi:hypothetical protein